MNRNPTLAMIIDPPLLLDALTTVFRQHFPNATLLGSACGAEALRLVTAPGQAVDVAVISDTLPDIPGDLLAKRLRWYAPDLRIVMVEAALARKPGVATRAPAAMVEQATARSGSSVASLVAALHRVRPELAAAAGLPAGVPTAAGAAPSGGAGSCCAPGAATVPLAGGPTGASSDASIGAAAASRGGVLPARGPFGPQRLTPRQMEVLGLLAQGWGNSTIAEHLHTSEKTVKAHVSAVFQVLDVSNRTQATLVAQRSGLVPA